MKRDTNVVQNNSYDSMIKDWTSLKMLHSKLKGDNSEYPSVHELPLLQTKLPFEQICMLLAHFVKSSK